MEHFQPALDPRKQELLEARFLGTRVRYVISSLAFVRLYPRRRLLLTNSFYFLLVS
jgi:hypothetical protein